MQKREKRDSGRERIYIDVSSGKGESKWREIGKGIGKERERIELGEGKYKGWKGKEKRDRKLKEGGKIGRGKETKM